MKYLRFIAFLIGPLFVPLLLIPMLILIIILYCVCGIWNTWYRATKDPRYDEYWYIWE